MKERTKIIIIGTIGISALVLVVLYNPILIYMGVETFRVITLKSDLNTILHRTDHKALLAACRSVMKEGYRGEYMIAWPDRHPDAEKLPKEILALKPTYIDVLDDGRVRIEMWGGMSHFGVIAYVEDYKPLFEGESLGDKKLIEGLWFYSDFIDLSKEE